MSSELNPKRQKVTGHVHGILETPCLFDSSFCFVVAPDDMLTGVIEKLMSVCFNSRSTHATRKDVEGNILNVALMYGLAVNSRLLKYSNHRKYCAMNMHEQYVRDLILFNPVLIVSESR